MVLPVGLVFIETKTATNQSSLNFTSGLLSTYNLYMLVTNACTDSATSGAMLVIQLSTNGGTSYINTNYGSGDIGLQVGPLNGGTTQLSMVTYLANMTSGSYKVTSISSALSTSSLGYSCYGDFYTVSSVTVNAFRIVADDGTNFNGTFSLYGVVQ